MSAMKPSGGKSHQADVRGKLTSLDKDLHIDGGTK